MDRVKNYKRLAKEEARNMYLAWLRFCSYILKLKKLGLDMPGDIIEIQRDIKDKFKIMNNPKYRMEWTMESEKSIYYKLKDLNERIREESPSTRLELIVVGGSALLMQGIKSAATEGFDIITRISREIQELIGDSGLDVNSDSMDFANDFEEAEMFPLDEYSFSNIDVFTFDVPLLLKSKLHHSNSEKLLMLKIIFEEVLGEKYKIDDVKKYFEDHGIYLNDIEMKTLEKLI
ncbi:MAG: hypothetical protein LBD63_01715 [Mycoplasmataceae bacterium]|jgi:hypothetical protein|nr:hypothetical protein [Mycoplasmataceae bacterium]